MANVAVATEPITRHRVRQPQIYELVPVDPARNVFCLKKNNELGANKSGLVAGEVVTNIAEGDQEAGSVLIRKLFRHELAIGFIVDVRLTETEVVSDITDFYNSFLAEDEPRLRISIRNTPK